MSEAAKSEAPKQQQTVKVVRPKGALKKLVCPPGASMVVDNKRHQVINFDQPEYKKYSAVRDGAIIRLFGFREGTVEMPISALQYWVPYEDA